MSKSKRVRVESGHFRDSKVKCCIRQIIRLILRVKDDENISDLLSYKKTQLQKNFFKRRFTSKELGDVMKTCGLSSGDIIMVHCAWRNMYNFEGTPKDVISILQSIVGESGTILMPSYGHDRLFFNVEETSSKAGVLSEEFRKMPGVIRSACTHCSVAGIGREANTLLCDHIKSRYGFDCYSPWYKMGEYSNAKIIFLGLGREPTKVSIFHCAGAIMRSDDEKLRRLLSKEYDSELVYHGTHYKKRMYIRQPNHQNNNRVFKKILKSLNSIHHGKISNVDVVIISAKEAIEKSVIFSKKGIYCYKNMDRL